MPRRTAEDWARIVEKNFVSCPECEPRGDGEVQWIYGRGPADLRDLVGELVPEHLVDQVIKLARCPGCGSDVAAWGDVGTEWPFETEHRERVEAALRRWTKKLDDFAAYLVKTPALGAMHAVGKRLVKEIGQFQRADLSEQIWYRARRDTGKVFTADDLRAPDPDSVSVPDGRWNHPGQAHWYLADNPDCALAEVLRPGETVAWVQQWRVAPITGVLDVLSFGADDPCPVSLADVRELPLIAVAMIFGGYLDRPTDTPSKPQHLVTRFVLDAAKRAGFAGIRCESATRRGVNLIIFDRAAPVTAIGAPEKMLLDDPKRNPDPFEPMTPIDYSALL
jgi:hypothetical protein